MKSNILYVIENISFGGGERAFAQVINGLDMEKYEIYVACLPHSLAPASGLFAEEIQDNAQIISFDLRNRFNLRNIFNLIKIIKEKKIDLVHSQGARADFFSRIAARMAKVPAVVSTIAVPIEEYNVNRIKKAIYMVLSCFTERFVDKFIVVAQHLERKLVQIHKISPHKVVKIYNGVDIEKYNYNLQAATLLRKEMNIGPDFLLIGAIGRLTWEKGLPYFIEAIKKMSDGRRQAADKVKYLIVGEGELEENLREKVKSLKLEEKVIFAGFRKDVREILGAIDILVLSSLREGFPMIILEAMAMGKPIVAANIEGVNESIVDGVTGILVPPKDSEALAGAILTLIKDKDRAGRMGQAGREAVKEKFNINNMIRGHKQLYEELIAMNSGAS